MSRTNDYANEIFNLDENAYWAEGLVSLVANWYSLRGTRDPKLAVAIARILIYNGYPKWAKNWLFERSLYLPRNGEILRWLVEATAELRDHTEILRFGEIHEETQKISVTPNVHLMNSLLSLGLDRRFEEVYDRQKGEKMSTKGHRLFTQYLFYSLNDFPRYISFLESRSEELERWTDFNAHLALSYHHTNETEKGMKSIERPLYLGEANASFTAYEMNRESNPLEALRLINRSLKKLGYAPLHTSWMNSGFDLEQLSCGNNLPKSNDSRLVSVIMTVHKMNPMFATAISSILNQSHSNLELLVCDDFSSKEDYEEYELLLEHDKRARIIRMDSNRGTYVARNHALKQVKGDFVLFMDSDDWTHPQRIEKALQRLDENPKAVVAVDSYVRMHKSGKLAMVGSYFVRKCMLGLWRTEVVRDQLGGFDSVRISADSELLERAQICHGREGVNHVKAPVYVAYYHEKSLTGGGEFGFGWRGIVGNRSKYAGAFRTWHKRMGSKLINFNMRECLTKRQPFHLPQGFFRDGVGKLALPMIPKQLEHIRSDCSVNALSTFFDVPELKPEVETPHVNVCLATYPARFNTIGRTVRTLLNQSRKPDQIHIWVNESHDPPPLPDDESIVLHMAPNENLTDKGKFAAAQLAPEGIVILADDDLKYPHDYVETMVNEVNRFNGEVCVGLHGVVFPVGEDIQTIDDYFSRRRVHLYSRGLSVHLPCHVMGTGTMAFDSRKINFNHETWDHNKMVDLHVGVDCQKMRVPIVTIPRRNQWLRSFEVEESDVSIWQTVKSDTALQKQMVEVLMRVADWSFHLQNGVEVSASDLLENLEISPMQTSTSIKIQNQSSSDEYIVNRRWKQNGRILSFNAKRRNIFFEMPVGWKIEHTHPDLFRLVHYLLMSPWEKMILQGWAPTRKKGWRSALSYSAGLDSHACLELMPKNTVVMYHERSGFPSQLDHTNAGMMLESLNTYGHPVVSIKSNHELIRTDYEKNPGFSTDFAVGSMAILLADFYGLSGIAFGMPLENSYLFHGHLGRDFEKSWYWKHHKSVFAKAGLDLILPTAGISELINLKICLESKNGHFAESCLRSKVPGKVCGLCWKCFRKNTLKGEKVTISPEVNQFLQKQPLKQAASTIWALQKMIPDHPHILKSYPHLGEVIDLEVDWLNRYHPSASHYLPKYLRPQYLKKLNLIATPMTSEETEHLHSLVIYSPKEE